LKWIIEGKKKKVIKENEISSEAYINHIRKKEQR
jgi:hypothetical protein